MMSLYFFISKYYICNICKKLYCMLLLVGKSIFLSRMSDGKRCSGSIPYGYNRLPEDKQTLVVDPVTS